MEENQNKSNKWYNFKKWVYKNHKYIGLICLVILLIIGMFYHNPELNTQNYSNSISNSSYDKTNFKGGVVPVAAAAAAPVVAPMVARVAATSGGQALASQGLKEAGKEALATSATNIAANAAKSSLPSQLPPDLASLAGKPEELQKLTKMDKLSGFGRLGVSGVSGGVDYGMSKFREFSSVIYEFLYQIAFIIIIMIIIFPSIAFFIIGIILFTLLRNKLNFLKST